MKIYFPTQPTEDVINKLKETMGDRQLGQIVGFECSEDCLNVVIKNMGTSTLFFKRNEKNDEVCFVLEKEKVALTHRAFKDGITKKIIDVIKKSGGKVEGA